MVRSIPRVRKKFKEGYTYLNRNTIIDKHPDYILKNLLKKFKCEDLHQYPDMFTSYNTLSEYLGVEKDKLLLTRGVEGSIKTVFESLNLKSTDKVGTFDPTFAMFKVYADVFNVELVSIKAKAPDYNITVDLVKEIVPNIKVLFLTNPMAHLENNFTNNELEQIITYCEEKNVIVFLDEVYIGWESKSYLPFLDKHNNLIISSSFSKSGFPSIKTGWLACNKILKLQLEATRGSYELDYFSCKTLEFIIENKDYFNQLKNNLLEIKNKWIRKFKLNSDLTVFNSTLYTIRLYSNNKNLIKKIYKNLFKDKIVVNIIDDKNLQFAVTANKEVESKFFKHVCR